MLDSLERVLLHFLFHLILYLFHNNSCELWLYTLLLPGHHTPHLQYRFLNWGKVFSPTSRGLQVNAGTPLAFDEPFPGLRIVHLNLFPALHKFAIFHYCAGLT